MQASKTHWPSLLILIILAFGIFFFLVITLATGITSIVNLFDTSADPAGMMIRSVAGGLELILLTLAAWFVLQKTMQKESADQPMLIPIRSWHVWAIPAVLILCLGIGALVAVSEIKWLGWLVLPALTVLLITLPIAFFLYIGTHGLGSTARWKTWSVLGIGMTLGPLLMIGLELMMLILFALIAVVVVAGQPELVQELSRVAMLLNQGIDEEATLELLAPYLANPSVLIAVFLYLALIVPLIEELLKPLGVWLFARHLDSPASGFVLGMLSGGVFALVESLNASGDGTMAWPVIVSVRAGTSLLHMTTSGLVGYATVRLFQEKKVGHMIATYLSATVLHGLWNACAVGTALGPLGELLGKPQWLWNFLPAALGGLAVLATGMLAVLLAANRRLRQKKSVGELGAAEQGKIPS